MTTRMILRVLAVVACLALAGSALAMRPPTAAEGKGIRSAVIAYIKNPSSHAASDNKIISIAISTVNTRYAGAHLSSASGASTALLERKKNAGAEIWKVIGFGSSQACSLAPKAVRTDLAVKCGMQ